MMRLLFVLALLPALAWGQVTVHEPQSYCHFNAATGDVTDEAGVDRGMPGASELVCTRYGTDALSGATIGGVTGVRFNSQQFYSIKRPRLGTGLSASFAIVAEAPFSPSSPSLKYLLSNGIHADGSRTSGIYVYNDELRWRVSEDGLAGYDHWANEGRAAVAWTAEIGAVEELVIFGIRRTDGSLILEVRDASDQSVIAYDSTAGPYRPYYAGNTWYVGAQHSDGRDRWQGGAVARLLAAEDAWDKAKRDEVTAMLLGAGWSSVTTTYHQKPPPPVASSDGPGTLYKLDDNHYDQNQASADAEGGHFEAPGGEVAWYHPFPLEQLSNDLYTASADCPFFVTRSSDHGNSTNGAYGGIYAGCTEHPLVPPDTFIQIVSGDDFDVDAQQLETGWLAYHPGRARPWVLYGHVIDRVNMDPAANETNEQYTLAFDALTPSLDPAAWAPVGKVVDARILNGENHTHQGYARAYPTEPPSDSMRVVHYSRPDVGVTKVALSDPSQQRYLDNVTVQARPFLFGDDHRSLGATFSSYGEFEAWDGTLHAMVRCANSLTQDTSWRGLCAARLEDPNTFTMSRDSWELWGREDTYPGFHSDGVTPHFQWHSNQQVKAWGAVFAYVQGLFDGLSPAPTDDAAYNDRIILLAGVTDTTEARVMPPAIVGADSTAGQDGIVLEIVNWPQASWLGGDYQIKRDGVVIATGVGTGSAQDTLTWTDTAPIAYQQHTYTAERCYSGSCGEEGNSVQMQGPENSQPYLTTVGGFDYVTECLNATGATLIHNHGTITVGVAADSTQMAANESAINAAILAAPVGGAVCFPDDDIYVTWDQIPERHDVHIELARDEVTLWGAGACGWGDLPGCSFIGTPGAVGSNNPYFYWDPATDLFLRGHGIGITMNVTAPDSISNIAIKGLHFDGHAGWTGDYSYNYAGVHDRADHENGWDLQHKGLHLTGGEPLTGVVVEDVQLSRYRGEMVYQGGFSSNDLVFRRYWGWGSNGSVFNVATSKNLLVEDSKFGNEAAAPEGRVRFWYEALAENLPDAYHLFRRNTFEACMNSTECIAIPYQAADGTKQTTGQVWEYVDSDMTCEQPYARLLKVDEAEQTVILRRNNISGCSLGFFNGGPGDSVMVYIEDNVIDATGNTEDGMITFQGNSVYVGRVGGNTFRGPAIPIWKGGGNDLGGWVFEDNTFDGLASPATAGGAPSVVPFFRNNTYGAGWSDIKTDYFNANKSIQPLSERYLLSMGNPLTNELWTRFPDGAAVRIEMLGTSDPLTLPADSTQHGWDADLVLAAGDTATVVYDRSAATWYRAGQAPQPSGPFDAFVLALAGGASGAVATSGDDVTLTATGNAAFSGPLVGATYLRQGADVDTLQAQLPRPVPASLGGGVFWHRSALLQTNGDGDDYLACGRAYGERVVAWTDEGLQGSVYVGSGDGSSPLDADVAPYVRTRALAGSNVACEYSLDGASWTTLHTAAVAGDWIGLLAASPNGVTSSTFTFGDVSSPGGVE